MKKCFVIEENMANRMRKALVTQNRMANTINAMAAAGVDLGSEGGQQLIKKCIDAELEYKTLLAQAVLDAKAAGTDLTNYSNLSFWSTTGVLSWDDEKTIADEGGVIDPAVNYGEPTCVGVVDEGYTTVVAGPEVPVDTTAESTVTTETTDGESMSEG